MTFQERPWLHVVATNSFIIDDPSLAFGNERPVDDVVCLPPALLQPAAQRFLGMGVLVLAQYPPADIGLQHRFQRAQRPPGTVNGRVTGKP